MRALVTGGAGFIGSALCGFLIEHTDYHVLNVDKLTYAANLNSLQPIADNPRYALQKLDICDRNMLVDTIQAFQPDTIFHLAAETHVDRSILGASTFVETNLIGTFNLLEAARAYWDGLSRSRQKRFRVIHVSTDEVYGSLGPQGQFTESSRYDPSSPYSASKAGSDHLASAWVRTYGLPVIISNCSNNYGPYQFPEKLIPLMILKAVRGEPLPVYGDGSNIRDWLHVEDHVRALLLLAERGRPGEIYNIGGDSEHTNLQVVEAICDLLDTAEAMRRPRRELINFVPDRPGHDFRYAIDASKIRDQLGWRPQHSFETGLAETVDWYLARTDWWQPIIDGVYQGERLGELPKTKAKEPLS